MIVAQFEIIDSPVTNWTYGDPRVRFRVPVGVAYAAYRQSSRRVGCAARKSAHLDRSGPSVSWKNLARARSSRVGGLEQRDELSPRRYRSDLNFAIEKKLREAGIAMPFPAGRSPRSQRRASQVRNVGYEAMIDPPADGHDDAVVLSLKGRPGS